MNIKMNARKRRKSQNFGALLLLFLIVLVAGVAIYVLSASLAVPESLPIPNSSYGAMYMPRQVLPLTETQSPARSNLVLVSTNISDIAYTGYLALINRQHGIAAEPDGNSLVMAWPTVPVSFVDGMYVHQTALQAVADMFDTFRNAEIGTLFVSSGFRGQELQAELYNNGANSAFALPPGFSEHHTGLAVDILAIGISQAELANSAEGQWLAENSYRYGLILRYPQGATHITGIKFEPWHFRYVGKVHAYYMKQHNLVLEEYIELIQATGGITFEMDNRTYHVLHQTLQGGMIYLPQGLEFTVSCDNMGGFIITAVE